MMMSGHRLEKALRPKIKTVAINLFPPARRLVERLDHLRFEVNRLEAERNRLETERNRLETERNRFETERNRLETERNRLETERNRLEELAAELEKTLATQSEENVAAVNRLDAEIAHLRGERNILLEDCTRFRWTSQHAVSPGQIFSPPALSASNRKLVDRFTKLIYHIADKQSLRTYFSSWMGYDMFKWPTDLWMYQELVTRLRPDVIIETGTYRGGSALFLACICDLIDHGQVVTIDIDTTWSSIRPRHPRITYLDGSSTEPEKVAKIEEIVAGRSNSLVILDSDHTRDHVLDELRIYQKFVPPGGYLVVEDTAVNGHPVYPDFGPGPWEAVEAFLAEDDGFEADPTCERIYVTQNPRGFLRRRVPAAAST